jgi:hypothetical protein
LPKSLSVSIAPVLGEKVDRDKNSLIYQRNYSINTIFSRSTNADSKFLAADGSK